jgi:BMFP domain-containing protein YqiC
MSQDSFQPSTPSIHMPKKKPFLEDVMTIGSGVLSNLAEARHELKEKAKKRAGSVIRGIEGSVVHGLDVITRKEFDGIFAMIAKARNAQEDLVARLARLEGHMKISKSKKTVSSSKKRVKTKKTSLPSVKTSKKRKAKK